MNLGGLLDGNIIPMFWTRVFSFCSKNLSNKPFGKSFNKSPYVLHAFAQLLFLKELHSHFIKVCVKPWFKIDFTDRVTNVIQYPSKIEWDFTNGPCSVSCDRAIGYSGFFGVRETWVLLEISWTISPGSVEVLCCAFRRMNLNRTSVAHPWHLENTVCEMYS